VLPDVPALIEAMPALAPRRSSKGSGTAVTGRPELEGLTGSITAGGRFRHIHAVHTEVGKECLRTIAAAPTSEQRTINGRNDRAARGPARHNWANSGRSERLSKRWLVGNGTRPGQSHVIVEACNVMQIASPGRASPAIRRTP
jgi:hypothetical protein